MSVERNVVVVTGPFTWDRAMAGVWTIRIVWMAVCGFGSSVLVVGVPTLWRLFLTICSGDACLPIQPSAEGLASLSAWGLAPGTFAVVAMAGTTIVPIVIITVMGVLLWHRTLDPVIAPLAFAGPTCALIGPLQAMAAGQAWLAAPLAAFWAISGAGFAVGLLSFPDGRFVPRWTRLAAAVLAVGALPVLVPTWSGSGGVGEAIAWSAFGLTFPVAFVAWLIRYVRHSGAQERRQIKVVAITVALMFASQAAFALAPDGWLVRGSPGHALQLVVNGGLVAGFWVVIAVSVRRHRLFDIDLVIHRTVVYGGMLAAVTGAYLVLVVGVGRLVPVDGSFLSLIMAGAIAVAFHPLFRGLQRGAGRWLYGHRDEPYEVLSRLGRSLEASMAPASVLPSAVSVVADALRLPFVAIDVVGEGAVARVAQSGRPTGKEESFPLVYGGETIGALVAAPRDTEDRLGRLDLWLLADLSRHVGVAVRALLLQADLDRARLRVVSEREEARRRLGNDLHDGVGHQLVGLTRRAEAAGHLIDSDPDAAKRLLQDLVAHGRLAADAVRALAHDLHPPELAVLGLAGAIREWAELELGSLHLQLDIADDLGCLPAATEKAAYYVVREALQNVRNHAGAAHCRVQVALEPSSLGGLRSARRAQDLVAAVEDDGLGFLLDEARGLGLTSMHERALEIGGTCHVSSDAGRGTKVVARLPIELGA